MIDVSKQRRLAWALFLALISAIVLLLCGMKLAASMKCGNTVVNGSPGYVCGKVELKGF